ncbi:hypothetical protein [Rhizobium leguminosarum]|uniref:hypothetical protein n=1 Tax=Rhizobium leguminosarum TaxID=384 RepID=UPI0010390B0A|nr:hypothetical protein [Rhizobium leguminosarum]MBB4344450.1 hypothetical protein [Rhizobium leguminosarum]MBB6297522.1 hypothetical protein [Rhizobium leguminosarum]TCA52865.1 hypothetical protein E0H71_16500 [Rhizobium leguminosarum bv. viciae]TCA68218.1 hypothetical protein E0H69_30715 [Rhizobium leguminosarum bv. viciae]
MNTAAKWESSPAERQRLRQKDLSPVSRLSYTEFREPGSGQSEMFATLSGYGLKQANALSRNAAPA